MATQNRKWVILRNPESQYPEVGADIEMQTEDVPEIKDGEFLVKVVVLTVDPYLRMVMGPFNFYTGQPQAYPRTADGEAVGRVVKSNKDGFKEGDLVLGRFGWQEYAVSTGAMVSKVPENYKPSHCLGALGMPGMTAYYGLLKLCEPKEGETVAVSGASGAVGALVGQIAKLQGARVVGFAGGAEKCAFLKEVGFDAAIDYHGKDEAALTAELKEAAPKGVDCYYENTGGAVSKAVLANSNPGSRWAVCGQIEHYANTAPTTDIPLSMILMKQMRITGFIVNKTFPDWSEGKAAVAGWIEDKKIVVREDTSDGIEEVMDAFLQLFKKGKSGKSNMGKKLVKLCDDEAYDRESKRA